MNNKNLKMEIPKPGMAIDGDVTFLPGEYDFTGKEGMIIKKSGITIDGNGAVIKGGSIDAGPLPFFGTGIKCEEVSGITIKNITIKGFKTAIYAKNCSKIRIENNNLSDNFTDPECGWDEHGAFGGIIFENVDNSTVTGNRANNVWDGLYLKYSNKNEITENDFSYCSNMCIKMWNACENRIINNKLNYGLRIKPGEVHARDSAGILIESGSSNNIFKGNEVTHGGDGIFIRVLNGWCSSGNYFEENDCSYANNNGFEAWANGNTYIRNKANYCSYGFWLGGSDDTLMLENEAAYNGTNFHNAPECFGNAGVAVVNGSSSHFKFIGNYVHDNNGSGVAIRFRSDYPAYHWIIEKNIIKDNKTSGLFKGHGIYVKNASWMDIGGNDISGNEGEGIFIDDNVGDLFIRDAKAEDKIPVASIKISDDTVNTGRKITFDGTDSNDPEGKSLNYRWDLGDGTLLTGPVVSHIYSKPGFYRAGLTVNNGRLSDIAFVNIYAIPEGDEVGTEDNISRWRYTGDDPKAVLISDDKVFVSGKKSIHLSSKCGRNSRLIYPSTKDLGLDISKKEKISFWVKFTTDAQTDWDGKNKKPVIRLHTDESNYMEYIPDDACLEQIFAPMSEGKYGWRYFEFNLNDPSSWTAKVSGCPKRSKIDYIEIDAGPANDGIYDLWIDGFKFLEGSETYRGTNIAINRLKRGYPQPMTSYCFEGSDKWAPLSGSNSFKGDITPRWSSFRQDNLSDEDWYGVDFKELRQINRLDLYFYHNMTGSLKTKDEGVPDSYTVEYWDKNRWNKANILSGNENKPQPNLNRILFEDIFTSKLRVVLKYHKGLSPSIYGFEVYNTRNAAVQKDMNNNCRVQFESSATDELKLNGIGVLLNIEHNDSGSKLSDLIVKLYNTAGYKPEGEPIKELKVSRELVKNGSETLIDMDYQGLKAGQRYAALLTQERLAESRTKGDYYRWVASHSGIDEYFGVYGDGEYKDDTSDWGSAWLKVYTDKYVIDYSNESESLGNRLGFTGMDFRWQTFMIKDPVFSIADGDVTGENGWTDKSSKSSDDWVQLNLPDQEVISSVNLYFDADNSGAALPEAYTLELFTDGTWAVPEEIVKPEIKKGLNRVVFKNTLSDKVRVSVKNPSDGFVCIKEIEIIRAK